MTSRNIPRRPAVSSPDTDPAEDTGSRIRAYLASMQPMKGIGPDSDAENSRATSAILQLASSAHGTDSPTYQLTRQEALDVVAFMRHCEPKSPRTWWSDPENAPSHWTGWGFVLGAVEDTLRSPACRHDTAATAAPVSASLNSPLAVLMHRLEVASCKLDLVVAHYPDPGECNGEDIGAIALTREVAAELTYLYCHLADRLIDAGLVRSGAWVDHFPEDLSAVEAAAGAEAQS